MKERYERTALDVIEFKTEDVITTSGEGPDAANTNEEYALTFY